MVKNGNDLKPEAFYVKSLNLSCRAKEHLFIYFKMMQKKKKRAEKGVTCEGFENYRFFAGGSAIGVKQRTEQLPRDGKEEKHRICCRFNVCGKCCSPWAQLLI